MDKPWSTKTPEMRKTLERMFPGSEKLIAKGKCPMCYSDVWDKDFVGIPLEYAKEYTISGMCVKCQDFVFKG